jgi:chemotaxis protein histidine kinase CheA
MQEANRVLQSLIEGETLTAREVSAKSGVIFAIANQLLIAETKKPIPLVELTDMDNGSIGYRFIGDNEDIERIQKEIRETAPKASAIKPSAKKASPKKPSPKKPAGQAASIRKNTAPANIADTDETTAIAKDDTVTAESSLMHVPLADHAAKIISVFEENKRIKKTKSDIESKAGISSNDFEKSVEYMVSKGYLLAIPVPDFSEHVYQLGEGYQDALNAASDNEDREQAAKQKADLEAKQKAAQEANQKAAQEANQKAEQEAKQKAEQEAKQKAEPAVAVTPKAGKAAHLSPVAKTDTASDDTANAALLNVANKPVNVLSAIASGLASKDALIAELEAVCDKLDLINKSATPSIGGAPTEALSKTIQYISQLEEEVCKWREFGASISTSLRLLKELNED